ncbi:TlpA family protein disulfide reductase [Mycobacterium helveticum]|uniref:TlpA family protein disulfide reductase n=1 Tax=Mycobacterium helveticum TaxID=2592811 RepID=A0A557XWH7_9MYCO|nr:TlpA disulfide reductase family protein [Mycobacterium helveticum]TVS86360.1 TlpA family protein disulfide reductase [Mycobacterium helveticum]TVS90406.1 TlpA family protein disulfide reductase [Mycobacterium helveticum]
MTRSTRWTVAIVAVVVALAAALVAQLRDDAPGPAATGIGAAREHRDADTPAALAGPRQRANLRPCPAPAGGPGPAALRGVTVECAADGTVVDVGRALAGRRVVLNFWAYWCASCTAELPALAEYQRRAGPAVTVVTVHQDENEAAALLRLAELGVRLPTLQDGRRRVAAALRVVNVMPATVVLRPDGSVAQTLPRAFASADEIAAAVGDQAE